MSTNRKINPTLSQTDATPRRSMVVPKQAEEPTRVAKISEISELGRAGTLGRWDDDLIAAMRDLYAHGDTEEALTLANLCSGDLGQHRWWLMRQVPRLLPAPQNWAPGDPRVALVLQQIDGKRTIAELLKACPIPESETMCLIDWLCAVDLVALDW